MLKLQVFSTAKDDWSLLGQMLTVKIPATTPVYFDGRYATTNQQLAVGDAVIAIIVPNITRNYHANEIDDLGP